MSVLKIVLLGLSLSIGATAAFAADEALLSSKVSQRHLIIEPQLNLAGAKSNPIQVALTLDACSGDIDHRILDVLVREKIPATLFVTVDFDGVGELVQIAAERGRKQRSNIKLGVCGEHGGDPASIGFYEKTGLDYVSCSPFRVPIARLAAAQAAIAATK